MLLLVSRQMDNWKLPHNNSSLNVRGIPSWQRTILTKVKDRTLWSIKCSGSAVFVKIHLCENKRKHSIARILSIFSNVLCGQQEEERWKEAVTYTASTRCWLRIVNYQNPETYPNGQCLIQNRISRHVMLKIYLRWPHKLPKPKRIFKNCRTKAYFDALEYNFLSFKAISPFFNVCTVWLYTISQCISEQNQLGFHIIRHWRSIALGFCRKLKLSSS